TLNAFNDSDLALDRPFEQLLRGTVFGAFNRGDGLLHAVEFDQNHALLQSAFVAFDCDRASQDAAAAFFDRGTGEFRILSESSGIRNGIVERYPIASCHSRCSRSISTLQTA